MHPFDPTLFSNACGSHKLSCVFYLSASQEIMEGAVVVIDQSSPDGLWEWKYKVKLSVQEKIGDLRNDGPQVCGHQVNEETNKVRPVRIIRAPRAKQCTLQLPLQLQLPAPDGWHHVGLDESCSSSHSAD